MALNFSFSQVEEIGESVFTLTQNQQTVKIPYYSSSSIYDENEGINRVVIVLHGQSRNANDYFDFIQEISVSIGLSQETIVFSPQFLLGEDLTYWNLDSTYAFWSGTTEWTGGYLSSSTTDHPRTFEISSFAIMDSIINHFLINFSTVEEVVFIGNSAGGQFVNRYAAGSSNSGEGKLKYVVCAPSHYLYFDDSRSINNFQTPIDWSNSINCNGYNNYRYGLDNLNPYMNQSTKDTIRARYFRKNVIYLIGSLDYGGTTYCASSVQGSHRFNRSTVYYQHLLEMFSVDILENQKIAIVDGVSHDAQGLFSSDCGVYSIFSDGTCDQFSNLTFPQSSFTTYNDSGPYPLGVSFVNESIEGSHPIVSSIWDFGNETVLNSSNAIEVVQYNMPGEYSVSLTSYDLIGLKDSITHQFIIQVDTVFGDLNWDLEIDELDASQILKHTTNQDSLTILQQEVGDVNRDSRISPFDASLILRYQQGEIDELPYYQDSLQPSGTLHSENQHIEIDDIITIPIFTEELINLYSFSFSLNFEDSLLSYGSVYSNTLNNNGCILEDGGQGGTVYVSGAGYLPLTENGLLLVVYFTASESFTDQTVLAFQNIIINENYVVDNFEITLDPTLNSLKNNSLKFFSVDQNYPNPFNSRTIINFSLKEKGDLFIYVHDINGRYVKTLLQTKHKAGHGSISWDGLNSNSTQVSSGIYYYTIETKNTSKTKKMILIK